MFKVTFEYADVISNWKFIRQYGVFAADSVPEAIVECKRVYGLGIDCEYRIISVEEV